MLNNTTENFDDSNLPAINIDFIELYTKVNCSKCYCGDGNLLDLLDKDQTIEMIPDILKQMSRRLYSQGWVQTKTQLFCSECAADLNLENKPGEVLEDVGIEVLED